MMRHWKLLAGLSDSEITAGQELTTKICKHLGWTLTAVYKDRARAWTSPEGDVCDNGGLCGPFYQHLPQYAFDLNVMRELELTLVGDEREAYCHAICACASAMQRASAYWKLVQ